MIEYRELKKEDISRDLFKDFIRYQVVNQCWRKIQGEWVIKEEPFIDDWDEDDYQFLVTCLKKTVEMKGLVIGAFDNNVLKGFVSVESTLFGEDDCYLDLSSLHVSRDYRGLGIGKMLFIKAKEWARNKGAIKLYISAHSAVESQAFYRKMGCVEAKFYHVLHVEQEPFDCQSECLL